MCITGLVLKLHWPVLGAPERFSDRLVLYAIYFINLVVPIGLVYILPALYRENKAAATLTVFILVLLILGILGVLKLEV